MEMIRDQRGRERERESEEEGEREEEEEEEEKEKREFFKVRFFFRTVLSCLASLMSLNCFCHWSSTG